MKKQLPLDAGEDLALSRYCRYCGASLISMSKMTDHPWVCSKNPKGEENRERKNAKRRKGNLKNEERLKFDAKAKEMSNKKSSKRHKENFKKEEQAILAPR